jgi:hypothetical protein
MQNVQTRAKRCEDRRAGAPKATCAPARRIFPWASHSRPIAALRPLSPRRFPVLAVYERGIDRETLFCQTLGVVTTAR